MSSTYNSLFSHFMTDLKKICKIPIFYFSIIPYSASFHQQKNGVFPAFLCFPKIFHFLLAIFYLLAIQQAKNGISLPYMQHPIPQDSMFSTTEKSILSLSDQPTEKTPFFAFEENFFLFFRNLHKNRTISYTVSIQYKGKVDWHEKTI